MGRGDMEQVTSLDELINKQNSRLKAVHALIKFLNLQKDGDKEESKKLQLVEQRLKSSAEVCSSVICKVPGDPKS
eukprot:CAMPEP_0168621810 /NCGR_PEP_ID=MMETSP0449_2-20121227/7907_1 /TAXON_ID=1082188 /ORGANISM="Strombidium rassoulzadegani, Strain ras09" /LENGTH=74 /DNA_ID=CAMNT_0008662983 /DNA_START=201 /DNA_END=425 /DNA_ORIENTATION=+